MTVMAQRIAIAADTGSECEIPTVTAPYDGLENDVRNTNT